MDDLEAQVRGLVQSGPITESPFVKELRGLQAMGRSLRKEFPPRNSGPPSEELVNEIRAWQVSVRLALGNGKVGEFWRRKFDRPQISDPLTVLVSGPLDRELRRQLNALSDVIDSLSLGAGEPV